MTSTGVVLRLDGERWNFHPSPTGHTRHIRHTVRTAANLQVRDLHAVLAGALGPYRAGEPGWLRRGRPVDTNGNSCGGHSSGAHAASRAHGRAPRPGRMTNGMIRCTDTRHGVTLDPFLGIR